MTKCKGVNDDGSKCRKQTSFKDPESGEHYCKQHSLPGMISTARKCKCGSKAPTYGHTNTRKRECCRVCAEPGMIDLATKQCERCNKKAATFAAVPGERPKYCKDCKDDDMQYVKGMKCKCAVPKQPSFGFVGDKTATCCKDCMEEGMVDIKNAKCKECNKAPSCGYLEDPRPTYCGDHKKKDMVDLCNARCELCTGPTPKKASFALPGQKATRCLAHKTEDMVNVVAQKCMCGQHQPYFGFESDARPTRCANEGCFVPGMIDMRSAKCPCGVQPVYGYPGDEKATCCTTCKKEGMVDIKNKRCRCGVSQAAFGFEVDKIIVCCNKCKEEGMVNLKVRMRCGCGRIPVFGFPTDKYASCCSACREDGMEDIVNVTCRSEHHPPGELFKTKVSAANGFVCYTCSQFGTRSHRGCKEAGVGYKMEASGLVPIMRDVPLRGNACLRQRPDFLFANEEETSYVIVEVDEHEHKTYDMRCEAVRMIGMWESLGHVPTTFMRYNPDKIQGQAGRDEQMRDLITSIKFQLSEQAMGGGLQVRYFGYTGQRRRECEAVLYKELAKYLSAPCSSSSSSSFLLQ